MGLDNCKCWAVDLDVLLDYAFTNILNNASGNLQTAVAVDDKETILNFSQFKQKIEPHIRGL